MTPVGRILVLVACAIAFTWINIARADGDVRWMIGREVVLIVLTIGGVWAFWPSGKRSSCDPNASRAAPGDGPERGDDGPEPVDEVKVERALTRELDVDKDEHG